MRADNDTHDCPRCRAPVRAAIITDNGTGHNFQCVNGHTWEAWQWARSVTVSPLPALYTSIGLSFSVWTPLEQQRAQDRMKRRNSGPRRA